MVSDIESYAFEEHESLRRAAVECLCNMSSCKDVSNSLTTLLLAKSVVSS